MDAAFLLLPVLAQDAGEPPPDGGAQGLKMLLTIGVIFVVMYFLLIRPQQKQEKERRAMLEALRKRDRVLTSGGVLGTVTDIRDDEVVLKVCENPDVKLRVRRSAVVEVLRDSPDAAPKAEAAAK